MPIRLLIADPHPAVLDGLRHGLSAEEDFSILACETDGEAAFAALQSLRPEIIVLDLALPKKDGLTLLAEMTSAGLPTRAVLFTASPSRQIVDAIRLGVQGIVSKDMPLALLVRCIREVHKGGRWLEKDVATGALNLLIKQEAGANGLKTLLTPREITVAKMVSEGLPNKRIATRLSISEGTAKLHLHRIYQKLQLTGRMELMNYLQKTGLP